VLVDDPGWFDGVRVVGADEHVWRHTRRGDKYVTVIIDLTGIRDGTGPARLLRALSTTGRGGTERALCGQPSRTMGQAVRANDASRPHAERGGGVSLCGCQAVRSSGGW